MKVAILSDLIRPNGAGIMALQQADLLSGRGHDVVILAGAASDSLVQAGSGTAPIRSFLPSEYPLDHPIDEADHTMLRRVIAEWTLAELESMQPRVVSVHNAGRIIDQHLLADVSHRYPVAFTAHDEWFITDSHYVYSDGGTLVRAFEPHRAGTVGSHHFDHVFEIAARAGRLVGIAPSAWLYRRWRSTLPGVQCVHLRNPVADEFFVLSDRSAARSAIGLNEETRIVLFVGNPGHRRKGLHLVTDALAMLSGASAPLLLVVGGDTSAVGALAAADLGAGPLRSIVESARHTEPSHRFAARTITVGHLPRELLPAVYASADLVLHPSLIDNLPTVPIEAGLCGTRCLAMDVGGTDEAIAEADGLMPPGISASDLAGRISDELASVRSEPADRSQARRQTLIDRFSPARHVELLDGLLQRLAMASS